MQKRQVMFFSACALFLALVLMLAVLSSPPPFTPAVPRPAGPDDGIKNGDLICLNTATAEELMTLPGLGPVLAQRILDYRERYHGFDSVSELLQVTGIGKKRFDNWKPYLCVGIWEEST